MIRIFLLAVLWSTGFCAAQASTLESEKSRLEAEAIETVAAELGLRLSAEPAREMAGWSEPKKIVLRQLPGWDLAGFEAVAPGVEIIMVNNEEAALAHMEGAQALVGFCSEKLLAPAKGLHWVQLYSSGVEYCVSNPRMQDGKRVLSNGQKLASPALGDHAIALMLALARGIDLYHANQLKGEWKRNVGLESADFMELDGRTVLVVGLGGIGMRAAKKAHGLGMRVIATRGSRREGPDFIEYVGLADEVNALASRADVVINTVPLTEQTRGMFDAAFFKAMKPTAFFITVGRGASTDTDALVAALQAGEIAGAGLDVTDPEPLPEGHPLWTLPRVLITPHTAARSDRARQRLMLLVRENLRRYVAGEALYSVVDIERGY
jgi:phosphoglycerate dehydrogenase-like enzyme